MLDALLEALSFAFGMFWEILWALILGFMLSAVVQAVVSKGEMKRLLPGVGKAHTHCVRTTSLTTWQNCI